MKYWSTGIHMHMILFRRMNLDKAELLNRFLNVTVWKKGDKRAPHKPLLILYMLGRLQRGQTGPVSFDEMEKSVGSLLDEFGPPRTTQPIYPFWYLQNDGLWQLTNIEPSPNGTLGPCPTKTFIKSRDVHGCFPADIEEILFSEPETLRRIAADLLEANFPATLHSNILQAVGLSIKACSTANEIPSDVKRARDPNFRQRILKAYEYRCAVCGFSVRLGNASVGLEAAHIKWHQAGGPDEECNGLALCSLHHSLFDRGVFSIDYDRKLIVSENAYGNKGFDEWLMRFHGNEIQPPQRSSYLPNGDFTQWHINEVFKGSPREFILA
jgi:putative restriction endonuclease